MRDDVLSKVRKIGKAGHIISKVGKVILAIGFIACLVSSILLMILPRNLAEITMSNQASIEVNNIGFSNVMVFDDDIVDTKLELNGIEFEIDNVVKNGDKLNATTEVSTNTIYLRDFVWVLGLGMIAMASLYVALYHAEKLSTQFETCESPFTDEIVKNIQRLAIALIPTALLSSTVQSISNSVLFGEMEVVVGVDLMTVLCILFIFMLASIFKYGTLLQQESDETL